MKAILIAFLLSVVSQGLIAQSAVEKKVLNVAERKFDWMIRGTMDSLSTILDPRLKFIHSNGWIQTREDVINDLQTKKLIYQKIELREMEARVYESLAVVTGKGTFSGKLNGTAFSSDLVFTEVYFWKKKAWNLVSRQATKLP
jgi:hypothetical protein